MYLTAIVLANITTTLFGPNWSIVNAFLFIGLDLTARDKLHEVWKNNHLVRNMFILILTGSIISYLLNRNAGQIAVASFIAFASASVVDTVVYHLLKDKTYLVKVNGSNVFSAFTDSIVFPTIAFGGFLPLITLGQFTAKLLGGFIWSLILHKRKEK